MFHVRSKPAQIVCRFQLACVVATQVVLGGTALAQGTFTLLQTGGGNPLVSATVPLVFPGNAPGATLLFQFGFTTAETMVPDTFADAVTAAITAANAKFLPLVTVDASGPVWAPGGEGTVPISETEIIRQTIIYPSSMPAFTFKQAWEVSVVIPQVFQGAPLNFQFDLFDNGNLLPSAAWFSGVVITPVPEPGAAGLVWLGAAGLGWWLRKRCA